MPPVFLLVERDANPVAMTTMGAPSSREAPSHKMYPLVMSHLLIESVDSVTATGQSEQPCPTMEDSIAKIDVFVKSRRKGTMQKSREKGRKWTA
jgi:hypothetical protein